MTMNPQSATLLAACAVLLFGVALVPTATAASSGTLNPYHSISYGPCPGPTAAARGVYVDGNLLACFYQGPLKGSFSVDTHPCPSPGPNPGLGIGVNGREIACIY
jgi:hypothetical protein